MTEPAPALLTITEAAQLLRAPVATLRYWRHLGTGPDGFRLGRRVVHRREDLDRWLAEQQQARSSRRQRARPPGCVLERFLSISGRAQFAVSVRQ